MPKAGMNVRLRDWRQKAGLTRAEMAKMVNLSESGVKHSLTCDEERIRRWEAGEVSWPREEYRLALAEITRLAPEDLGFVPIRRSRARAAPADEAADETISAQSAHDFPLWQAGLNFPPFGTNRS